jgi:hypothetical protein
LCISHRHLHGHSDTHHVTSPRLRQEALQLKDCCSGDSGPLRSGLLGLFVVLWVGIGYVRCGCVYESSLISVIIAIGVIALAAQAVFKSTIMVFVVFILALSMRFYAQHSDESDRF